MGNLRKKVRIAWDEREPVEVQLTARDLLKVDAYYQGTSAVVTGFAQMYAALVRSGHDVPPTFEQFLDVVDDAEPVGTVVDVPGPTQPGPSDGVLLR